MQLVCPHCQRTLEYSGDRPSFCGFCGRPLPLEPLDSTVPDETRLALPPRAGTLDADPEAVGGYRLLRRLGAGGMGTVFEAEESATGRRVALKLIAPEFAESPETVERFRQEGRLASGIAHPRCVFVLAADEDAGRPYIVMELMPGSTLKDLVETRGPLPQEEAVAQILDVIDGLREAHRLGVIHRDVKPSNCFLDGDGRVKVGDFGLSKSLAGDAGLTRSGAFLGTPFFASPEQIRRDPLDQQTDVYSVAATLYFLLTGRAPHETDDAAATMARIVADPAPPVRGRRPDVSPALERVVLRGLERPRERRWRSLDELRDALLPFAPGRLSIGGMGIRFGAYLIDYLLLTLSAGVASFLILWLGGPPGDGGPDFAAGQRYAQMVDPLASLLYFTLLEGLWGCSVGKRLLRLRVCALKGSDPPGLPRALVRSFISYVLISLGGLPFLIVFLTVGIPGPHSEEALRYGWLFALLGLMSWPLTGLGIGILVSTMRARNGYRGLHEFLSGTRTVSLPEGEPRRALPSRLGRGLDRPEGLPERVGPFEVRGALPGSAGKVLLAEDVGLGRQAVLWLRPPTAAPLEAGRRDIGRPTRWRWLSGGVLGAEQWDAFLASPGCPLPALVAELGPLTWAEARPVLEQLAEELAAAGADGTLPRALAVDQVWVQSQGAAQLLDWPLTEPAPEARPARPDPEHALPFLKQAAVLALEGKPRVEGDNDPKVRAPLPEHAARCLSGGLHAGVRQFQADLAATRDRPAVVTRARRFGQVVTLTVFLSVGLFCCMLPSPTVPSFLAAGRNYFSTQEAKEAQRRLELGATSDFLGSASDPNPFVRLKAAVQLKEDLLLRDRLGQRLEQSRRERQAYLQSLGFGTRHYVLWLEGQFDAQRVAVEQGEASRDPLRLRDFRPAARRMADFEPNIDRVASVFAAILVVMLASWPVLWVAWTFMTRGGLSLHLLGLSLVRPDGTRAPRWRCAWRAVLVWTPLAGLLGLSAGLEMWHWTRWSVEEPLRDWWMLRLSSVAWWAACATLATYLVLALWAPARGPHDRLAGTYLVPR